MSTSSVRVDVHNDAVSGYTSGQVVQQLTDDEAVIAQTAAADAVEIEVGANDVAYAPTCGTSVSCYSRRLPEVEANLTAVVQRVHELTAARHPLVVLLDYWSVWLGGAYAAGHGQAYVTAAAHVTDDVNAVIKSVAKASGSAYVDLRAAFKGPDYAYDETHFLADDGDHPNAAGHRRIARATVNVIEAVTG